MCRASHYSRGQACLALYGRANFRCARDGIFQFRITVHQIHEGSRDVVVDFACPADSNAIDINKTLEASRKVWARRTRTNVQ